MPKEALCLPCNNNAISVISYSATYGENATSYNKSNKFNNWFAKNGRRVFYGAQFLGNVGLLTYSILEQDWFTFGTAVNNIARNAYGSFTSASEKKDGGIMLWGMASNLIQACSTLGGAPLTNALAGGLASFTYGLRFGAHHLRKSGRKKEIKAANGDLPPNSNKDNLIEYLDNRDEIAERKALNSKRTRQSKRMRLSAYNIEKVAATSFVGRGISQLLAGIEKGNEVGMGTGGLFIFGALGMLKGDFAKGKNAKLRCFYPDTKNIVKTTSNLAP